METDEWESHPILEEPIGSMLTANVHTGPAMDPLSASKILEKKAEAVRKRDSCKNRNDNAVLSIDTEWHVCPGDTSVQILQKKNSKL